MNTPASQTQATHAGAPATQAQRPFRVRPGLIAAALALALAYGSLIPFDFAWSRAVTVHGGIAGALMHALTSPAWTPAGPGRSVLGIPFALSDLLANLALYLPLGVALRMAIRARWCRWPVELVGTAGLAFALSWMVESMQALMPARVASLNDVAANTGAALLAALIAPYLWGLYKRLSFALYCRLSIVVARLRGWCDRPWVAMAIALVNALLVGVWYVLEVRRGGASASDDGGLPFERAFELPYDLGAVVLGRALLVYAGLGCLLLLLTHTGKRRLAMGWVVLGVALLALGAELSRAATHNATPDITGPLLALAAGTLMTVTVYSFSLAVRRSNRRRRERAFDGPDRRRRPHEYIEA